MTIEMLRADMETALRNRDTFHKKIFADMIDAIQKASITNKGRIEITEQLVDETLIKYQKTIQEMIDTCPPDRIETLNEYKRIMEVVKQYAPQLMTDKTEITSYILMKLSALSIPLEKSQKGNIMKTLSKNLKGKADMKIVSQVVNEILE